MQQRVYETRVNSVSEADWSKSGMVCILVDVDSPDVFGCVFMQRGGILNIAGNLTEKKRWM